MMRDPSRRVDWSDELKYLPLAKREGWYASLGGEVRPFYERYINEQWGSQPQDLSGYLLNRIMPHADVHFGERVRFFGQLNSSIEAGRRGGPRPMIDEDILDVNQAFVDIIWPFDSERSVTLRPGRQELAYGTGRIISSREGKNVRQSFDAGKLMLRMRSWKADGFLARPIETNRGVLDDREISGQTFWGVYSMRPDSVLTIDLYYLGLDRQDAIFDQGQGDELRHTIGIRLSGEWGPWDYNPEFIYQFGSFDRDNIRAWGIAFEAGYTLQRMLWQPRLGLRADAASGDRDPDDPDLETFYPLFPRGAYFGQLASVGPLNLLDVHPSIGLSLPNGISLTANWVFFWRQSIDDGLYSVPGALLRTGQQSRARFIGHQPGFDIRWRINRHTEPAFSFGRFLTGRFLRETPPGKNTTFLAAWVTYTF